MTATPAELRHRELTQEIYNIGDELAEYLEHLIEAINDWDAELVEDCLAEFAEIAEDARIDARPVTAELAGLRQALTSGVRAGTVSFQPLGAPDGVDKPAALSVRLLRETHPIQDSPIVVRELAAALHGRTADVIDNLTQLVDWVLHQTRLVANDLDAAPLPKLYRQIEDLAKASVRIWLKTVAQEQPAFTRTMRGSNPPAFLAERIRVQTIAARVAANKAARDRSVSGGGYAS